MSNTQKIEALNRRAATVTDADKLHKIALQLRDLGAWEAMEKVERRALEIERQQAEKVNA